jgi:hypothetical protein
VKPGKFAELVETARSHYSNVEHGRKVGSPELFGRCAANLSRLLGTAIDPSDLIECSTELSEATVNRMAAALGWTREQVLAGQRNSDTSAA